MRTHAILLPTLAALLMGWPRFAFAMVGGQAIDKQDPLIYSVAQIATWCNLFATKKMAGGGIESVSIRDLHEGCTATFVAEDVLLTAAHCIADVDPASLGSEWKGVKVDRSFGGTGRVLGPEGEVRFAIVDFRSKGFSSTDPQDFGDVALVKIDRPLAVQSLRLLNRHLEPMESERSYGYGVKIAGAKEVKLRLDSRIENKDLPDAVAKRVFQNPIWEELTWGDFSQYDIQALLAIPSADPRRLRAILTNPRLIFLQKSGGGHCWGDSGGPNFARLDDGGYAVAGVTSQADALDQANLCTELSVAFALIPFRQWLDLAARDLGASLTWAGSADLIPVPRGALRSPGAGRN